MDQGARLVEMGRGKGNPKLDRREGKTSPQIRLTGIELGNPLPALSIMGLLN